MQTEDAKDLSLSIISDESWHIPEELRKLEDDVPHHKELN